MNNTIEERIRRTQHALTLIAASCVQGDNSAFDPEDVVEAVLAFAIAAREDMSWIQQLPAVVLNLPAPCMSEIEDRFGVGSDSDGEQNHRERMVMEALTRAMDKAACRV